MFLGIQNLIVYDKVDIVDEIFFVLLPNKWATFFYELSELYWWSCIMEPICWKLLHLTLVTFFLKGAMVANLRNGDGM